MMKTFLKKRSLYRHVSSARFFSRLSSTQFNPSSEQKRTKYFDKILIANRGEIACRVMKTCKRLGIKTVAVFSDADANAKHVKLADEAYYIGPSVVAQSYNKMQNIVKACKDTGAQAVHPGYGFLSENTDFAAELEKNGIVFLGPPSKAIDLMGDKIESKRTAKAAKVSIIPGFDGPVQSADHAVQLANELIGYPVMIKPSGGGGGKGMRVCYDDEQLREGFRLGTAESLKNFASADMLIEKFIEQPRHIEIQVLCDKFGNAIYLNERECSIQRRNQKVIEEAPSTKLTPEVRAKMGEQACQLAKAVGYVSAGTVEMLVDPQSNFYFLEMNTRLQVEHPVTEYITGVDLVEQMIRIGAGYPLELKQEHIQINGWATECRVYAEDPLQNFAPSIGELTKYVEPYDKDGNIRVDSGIQERSEISVYYDPLICKLITYGKDREESRKRMIEALDSYVINGVRHNIALLRTVLEHPKYIEGNISTKFIAEEFPKGFQGIQLTQTEHNNLLATGALVEYLNRKRYFDMEGRHATYVDDIKKNFVVTHEKNKHNVQVAKEEEGTYSVLFKDTNEKVIIKPDWDIGFVIFKASFNNEPQVILQVIERQADKLILQYKGTRFELNVRTPRVEEANKFMPYHPPPDLSKFLVAPMPGAICSVAVKVGDVVKPNQELCVIEAMKMQNVLRSHGNLKVQKVNIKPGDVVSEGALLIEFEKTN